MSVNRSKEQIFKTTEIISGEPYVKTWKYLGPKITGSVKSRGFTGFYTFTDEKARTQKALIKQDPFVIHNISEFLAGKIYQKIIPLHSAKIFLTRADDSLQIGEDENVYIVSEFIPNLECDLYANIQEKLHKNPERSRHGIIEFFQILLLQMRHLPTEFSKATDSGDFSNFGEVSGPSFILNNLDTHLANLVVINDKDQKESRRELGVIDYGYAWRDMTSKIHPHSFMRFLWSNARRIEGWNNFVYYPKTSKITPHFVHGLDKTINEDLSDTIDEAFDELAKFYRIEQLIQFLKKTNLIDSTYKTLRKASNSDALMLDYIKSKIITIIQKRQMDLSRYSAQIKMDLCLKEDRDQKKSLVGYIDFQTKKMISFADVVFQHIDYFTEILCGKEQCKFRQSTHKKRADLINLVKNESAYVVASLILLNKKICEKYRIQTIDRAFEVIQKEILHGTELEITLQNAKTKILEAKDILNNSESLIKMAKNNFLAEAKLEIIAQLIEKGSNPDMCLSDGSKIIDHALDRNTRLLLVKHGAKITKRMLKQLAPKERDELIEVRKTFLRNNHHSYMFELTTYFYHNLFNSRVNREAKESLKEKQLLNVNFS